MLVRVRPRFAFVFFLVEPAVADKGAERRGPRDVETGVAVEEADLEDIGPKKAPARPEDRRAEREAAAARPLLADEEIGEGVYFCDVARQGGERVVVEVAVERRHGAVALHLLVHEGVAAPAGPVAMDQAQAEVGI